MVHLLVHHHALLDKPCDVSNALYNSTSLSALIDEPTDVSNVLAIQ